VWLVPGLVVALKSSGQQGVVKRVMADGTCTLAIGEIGEGRMLRVDQTTSLSIKDLQLVPPVKWDNVKVVHGNERGLEAQLIGVDGADGVLKVKDKKGTIKILDMSNLGQIISEA